MTGLLKADLRRVFKDKLLIVMGILAVAFAVVTSLLYAVMFLGMSEIDAEFASAMLNISGKVQFFSCFSLGNNMGLIAPVFLAIVLCKDFSFGTVRNKIIAGKSRTSIFLSLFITCSIVYIAVMLLYAFITLGVSLLFFDYQSTPFTAADFHYFCTSLGFEILAMLYVSAMLSWLCASMKNVGIVIVLYVAVAFVLSMGGSILPAVVSTMEMAGGNSHIISILHFIDRINVGSMYIGFGTEYTLEDALYLTIPPMLSIAGFVLLGVYQFNKKDLK